MDRKRRMKRRSGFSLPSVLAAIAISAILFGASMTTVSIQGKKTNIRATSSQLSVIATAITDSYEDLGEPVFGTTDIGAFKDYLTQLQNVYLGVKFDMDSVTATANGFKVDTVDPKDSFGGDYHFRFVTAADTLHSVMICSWGPNAISEESTYADKNYGDDIVAIANVRE